MEQTSESKWLNEEERQAWLTLGSLMVQLGPALDTQLRRDSGISYFEYTVLSVLSEASDRTRRMSELAALADGSLSRLSQVVRRLEKHGWVRRSPDLTDGRYTLASLTDTGWEKVLDTAPRHVREVRRAIFDPLTRTQVQQLTSIGQRILRVVVPDDKRLDRQV
ncbi:MarR family transcriptional regulator [Rhodococcus sp. (in: high G+C Gram-positive bacteria)]|jgi:DNA-binding MarR family transcriptional regulator|uniref:MarR family winged helix-turn-helix transcriptional regulator n=1 Tax=Rhodococcus sp. TaxID=1831 RepID=UPI002580E602|nr:MarR family transcriptional regulator [Rhodococcus sp. (in: high G+C Gram-positive bacteria)]MBQ7805735.1 MarR family transcriptional regulator [Rhodococcus sp. (in: high G+C Gram-positive bacteria)]